MSKHGGPFPTEDAMFNQYLQRAVPHLLTNWNRLVAPPIPPVGAAAAAAAVPADPRRAQLETFYNQWNGLSGAPGIYSQSQNPDIRTATITGQKDTLRTQIEILMRNIFDDIPQSWLTAHDREILHLPVRKTERTHHTTPIEQAPVFGMEGLGSGEVKFNVRNVHDETRSSKEPDAEIEVKFIILRADEPRPTHINDMTRNEIFTKTIFILHCGTDNTEKVLFAAVRWVVIGNPARNSPWSPIQSIALA